MCVMRRCTSGFTLIEVLVALVLLALFAFAGYRALNGVLQAESHARGELERWQKLARVFARIEADMQEAVQVPPSPAQPPATFVAERTGSGEVVFRVHRLAGEAGGNGLQQVAYRFASGKLHRDVTRLGLVQVAEGGGSARPLLDGIEQAGFRYLDSAGNWRPDWAAPGELPRAVEVVVAWPDGTALRRVFRTQ
jgi:general secretion pathway protein J